MRCANLIIINLMKPDKYIGNALTLMMNHLGVNPVDGSRYCGGAAH